MIMYFDNGLAFVTELSRPDRAPLGSSEFVVLLYPCEHFIEFNL